MMNSYHFEDEAFMKMVRKHSVRSEIAFSSRLCPSPLFRAMHGVLSAEGGDADVSKRWQDR